jgi:trimeric autotransporter adhesin
MSSSPVMADGIRINLNDGSDVGVADLTGNNISQNGQNGIEFQVNNSNLQSTTLRDNTITGNTGDGIRLVNPTTNSDPTMNMVFERNTITNNTAGNGINVTLQNQVGRVFNTTLDNNTITGNGLNGVNLDLSQNTEANVIMSASATANPVSGAIGNNISNNGATGAGMGIRVNADLSAAANLRIGAVGDNGVNTVAGNRDAGIGVNLRNNAALTAAVANITISGTVNGTGAGADPNFNGEGFAVRMTENATFNDSVIGTEPGSLRTTNFTGNASHGISVFADGSSAMNNLRVQNVNSSNNLGTGNGLDIVRAGGATLNNTLVQLNTFNGNNNGVSLSGSNAAFVDEYTLNNNTISTNRANGIALLQRFDAQLQVDLNRNTITNNAGDGVQLREQANDPTDLRQTTGTWNQNIITGNTGDGIDLGGVHNLTIGTGLAVGNDISLNGQDGIRITGVGTANIAGNFIESNGANGIEVFAINNTVNANQNTIAGNTQTGLRLENQQGFLNATATNNIIEQNGIDGVEILSSGTNVFSLVTLTGNSIADNLGRGVDILTRADAVASVTITGNDISRNRREGVYLVNTASATQTQDSTTTALVANGALDVDPITVLNMTGNTVFDNGFNSTFGGTGLAVRVGTSRSLTPTSFTTPGQFVSTNGGPGFSAGLGQLTGAGGVLAAVDNNVFGGSAGSDVLFESFTSTINPATSAGTWDNQNDNPVDLTNDVFTVTAYEADPLARLDLRFTGNSGDSADVTRTGASYNNDESIFKSRTTGQNPTGPFLSGTRARNAQRLAARGGAFAEPLYSITGVSGNSDNFLYSGVGGSTFRRTTSSNTGGFTVTDSFLDAAFLGAGVGEQPFIWATIAD